MLELIGDLLIYGAAVALSPIPPIAVILLLRSRSGLGAGAAFLAARLLVLVLVAAVVALGAELLPEQGDASPVTAVLRIGLGIGLIVLAAVKWRARPKSGETAALPSWMASLNNSTMGGAARSGILLSAVNPKELAFGVGAGLTIASAHLGTAGIVVASAGYAVLACIVLIVAVVGCWLAEERVGPALDSVRAWLVQNYAVVVAIVLLLIGVVLIGESLGSF
ncbi:Sap-like sulfolipid-1-addressing protein [Microterricola gilva]|uniref:Sap-like sulfolipid-1-addressing protein n=1 Tax=Microterricola gilva TaxID=393267 RepID=A0A4Q8AL58_9MICO|nr:GAP family protein [Microterricola gilva]RZU65244.1 Sap-like sulfolipid-1-addressing protein [Microterricola gilva]